MSLKLSQLDATLRARIEKQIANEDRLGGVQPEVAQHKTEPALVGESSGFKARRGGVAASGPKVRVALIVFRHRLLDSDNLVGGLKPLRDEIARWLTLDDADAVIEWEYCQHQTRGRQGTAVRIERL